MKAIYNKATLKANLEQTRALANSYAAAVRERFGSRVGRIRMYGSAVRGDWTSESDVDVLVTLDRIDPAEGEWLSQKAFKLGILECGILLQPVFMPEDEFVHLFQRERAFALTVEREGIVL